jgi:hypothetical protein
MAATPPRFNQWKRDANNVSQSNNKNISSSGAFRRVGKIEPVKKAFKVTYQTHGETHSVFLGSADAYKVQIPGAPSVDLYRVSEHPDGTIVTEIAGKAWRSRTGRALMVRTADSRGEVMTPWKRFVQLVNGEITYAPLSRFGDEVP